MEYIDKNGTKKERKFDSIKFLNKMFNPPLE